MATARYSPDAHSVARRDQSPGWPRTSSERRRPRLLRACATEPSITTSNACKGLLTSPNTNRRATDLLSRVAISNATSSPSSTRSFGEESGEAHSACYFSFPSFDTWEVGEHSDAEKAVEGTA
ncbi:hypothetical protein AAE478_004687 [Parahypoxylon ruwenzoriense]